MAKRPFSIQTYFSMARERSPGVPPDRPPRPRGPVVWLHAGSLAASRALATLAARFAQNRPEIAILRTGEWEDGPEPLPPETPQDINGFLEHWRPDICVWEGARLRPALLWSAAEQGIPLLHIDPGGDAHSTPAPRWLPDPVPALLGLFDTIFLPDAAAERRLPRVSLSGTRLRRGAALTETTMPLDCNDDLHEEVMSALAGRPVWLAARLRAAEAQQVVEAHRRAVRLSHRLILVTVSMSETDGAAARDAAEATGMRLCRWDEGEMPDENTQVVLCAAPEELGLWYRIAPLAFLGGSLAPGHGGSDPYEAAALGTAILYGPNVGRYLAAYSTLVEGGAARIVRDVDSLAGAVSQLVAPDRAAAMAHAGWDIVSRGAAATDAVIDRIIDLLDEPRPRPQEGAA
ncbi:3-deoxy-D-manno-octulosonic acid transferase [Roseivivax halodurans JCM 10272]|uniref:3-deoxy-D-manno-octulosonic acid transferase n=1 Tax=Roseivivax halodurans JCM 10272 TaxID=1449350 RepID=X7EIT2_9RHOB|nr:glycosyltransferase N-terminal domain-containing protein [Roseivivax halodurans]ETX16009.1 3-deoxy-D-manno-octulosonic acid transferase [Roseivivax halodurans JCM 10272]